jgi:hypothetical protein
VSSGGAANLNYGVARYAGYFGGANGALNLNGGSLTVTNTCVSMSGYGLVANSSGASITNSASFDNVGYGRVGRVGRRRTTGGPFPSIKLGRGWLSRHSGDALYRRSL